MLCLCACLVFLARISVCGGQIEKSIRAMLELGLHTV